MMSLYCRVTCPNVTVVTPGCHDKTHDDMTTVVSAMMRCHRDDLTRNFRKGLSATAVPGNVGLVVESFFFSLSSVF